MKLVFMGTPAFAVPTLDALHKRGHQISAVFCQPDRPAGRGRGTAFSQIKQKAIELGLPVRQPENLKPIDGTISELKPDVLVVVAYGLKLPKEMLDMPKYGAVNLHPSLLPRYRGAAPINHALINGDKTTGITSILINERMDAGDIIMQEEVPIEPEENAGELERRLSVLGAELILKSLDAMQAGKCEFTRQDESSVTFAPKLSPGDGHINWNGDSVQIFNRIRGVTPRPGAFANFRGKRLEILKTNIEYKMANIEAEAGQIFAVEKNFGPVVRTGDGAIILTTLKPQGKREMSGSEFLRGYKPVIGERMT